MRTNTMGCGASKPSQYASVGSAAEPPPNFDYSSCPSMSAEARNLSEELFKLVDKDSSGKISEAEYTAACGIITQVSPELLPADFAKLDENRDGEVDRAEWSRRMGAVMQSQGSATFVEECFKTLRAVRNAFGDGNLLHPWIDIDFSSLGRQRVIIDGAHRRGILLLQLRKLMRFIESHAGADGNLVSRTGADGTFSNWWDRSPYNRGRPLNVYTY